VDGGDYGTPGGISRIIAAGSESRGFLLEDRRASGRRVWITAAFNRAARSAKAGVGPFQRSSSTSLNRSISVLSVARVRKSAARSISWKSVAARALALDMFTCQSRQSLQMDSRWATLTRWMSMRVVPISAPITARGLREFAAGPVRMPSSPPVPLPELPGPPLPRLRFASWESESAHRSAAAAACRTDSRRFHCDRRLFRAS